MATMIQFSIASEAIDVAALAAALEDPAAGAVLAFDGRVRNHNEGREVGFLEYQAYPALARKVGQRILEEEAARHGLLRARAVHRTGHLEIGQAAVWAGVAAAHRGPAFDGLRAILERLKYELPVWKKETYADGTVEWVGPDGHSAETGRIDDSLPQMTGHLEAIYLSDGHDFRGRHGQDRLDHGIRQVAAVECVAGMGLRGDRYFGHQADFKGQVTFFDAAVVDAVREKFHAPDLPAGSFRRNLIVRGARLGDWVGRRFRFQGIEFEGSEECRPCYWMDSAVGPGVEEFLKADCGGGLRARILSNGWLRISDPIPAP